MKVIDARFVVVDGTDEHKFIDTIVNKRPDVLGATVLENNGWGHLVPNEEVLVILSEFLGGDNEVINALLSGEVKAA